MQGKPVDLSGDHTNTKTFPKLFPQPYSPANAEILPLDGLPFGFRNYPQYNIFWDKNQGKLLSHMNTTGDLTSQHLPKAVPWEDAGL